MDAWIQVQWDSLGDTKKAHQEQSFRDTDWRLINIFHMLCALEKRRKNNSSICNLDPSPTVHFGQSYAWNQSLMRACMTCQSKSLTSIKKWFLQRWRRIRENVFQFLIRPMLTKPKKLSCPCRVKILLKKPSAEDLNYATSWLRSVLNCHYSWFLTESQGRL